MHPFISVIMPVYNNEKYFPKAVQSVLSQSFNDWELIIVEDGSTDNTPVIADKLAGHDKRIRVIHQKNQWVYASVNNGIEAAEGKYVFMFNSDDLLNQDALQRIYDVAVADDADIVMFNLSENMCDEEQNIIGRDINGRSRYLADDFSYTDRGYIHKKWIDFMKIGLVNHQCVYKAKLAKMNKMRNDTYAGDYLYNIQLADQINVAAGTSYEVYMYMNYQKEDTNISLGKYYGYEHDMYNEMYLGYKELFEQWGLYGNEVKSYLSKIRMQRLTREFRLIKQQQWSLDEKLKEMFHHASDDVIYEIALENDRQEELDSRVLSACRELFVEKIPDQGSIYYFLYELLVSLLRYEKTQEDMEKIKAGIYHELNPRHVGECFMKKLIS